MYGYVQIHIVVLLRKALNCLWKTYRF